MANSSDPSKPTKTGPPPGFVRLKPATSLSAGFFIAAVFAIVFSVVTVLIIADGADSVEGGKTNFLVLSWGFGLASIALIAWAVKALLRWTLTGQTLVDVSPPVAVPGGALEVIVHQPGKFKISKCTVALVCEEQATYMHGTDTTTKTEEVQSIPVCDLQDMSTRKGQMLTRQTTIIPADVMPSFSANNNKIVWMIQVKMEVPRRPDVVQNYPFKLVPRAALSPEAQ